MRPELGAVYSQEFATDELKMLRCLDGGAEHFTYGFGVVFAEGGYSVVIGTELLEQPLHFDVAPALALEVPRGAHPVEIAVNVELQQVGRMVSRTAVLALIDFSPRSLITTG